MKQTMPHYESFTLTIIGDHLTTPLPPAGGVIDFPFVTGEIDFPFNLQKFCIDMDNRIDNLKQVIDLAIKDFSWALRQLRTGKSVTRTGWNNKNIWVTLQVPDTHSKMTEPYLYMTKGGCLFPLDLSCESLLADDWVVV